MTMTVESCGVGNASPDLERIVVEMDDRVLETSRRSSHQNYCPGSHARDIHNPCPVADTGK